MMDEPNNNISETLVIKETDSLGTARDRILQNTYGSVVICDQEFRPVGLITERDLISFYYRKIPLSSTVKDFMTTDLVTAREDRRPEYILQLMIDHNIRRIPIVDDRGRLINILTQDFLVKSIEKYAYHEKLKAAHIIGSQSVFYTVNGDDPISSAIQLMVINRISMIPVISSDIPVGIITESDILKLTESQLTVNEPVSRYMSSPVYTINEDCLVEEIVHVMEEKGIRHAIVVNAEGRLYGTITNRDILRNIEGSYNNFLEFKLKQARKSMNAIPHMIVELTVTEDDYLIHWINSSAKNIFPGQVIDEPISNFIEPSVWSRIQRTLENSGKIDFEHIEISGRTFEIHGLRFDNGNIQLFLNDITHLKSLIKENQRQIDEMREARNILQKQIEWRKKSESRLAIYREVLDQSQEVIFILDYFSGAILESNREARETLGFTAEELARFEISDLLLTENEPGPISHDWPLYIESFNIKKHDIFSAQLKRKDGSFYNVEAAINLVEYKSNKFIVSMFRDITDRLKMIEADRLRTHYIQSILDTQPDMIVVSDGDRILSANKSFLTYFSINSMDEFYKNHKCVCDFFKNREGYIFAKTNEEWIGKVAASVANNIEPRVIMSGVASRDERAFLLRINKFPPNPGSYLIAFTDITEIEKIQLLLADTNRHLEEKVEIRTSELLASNKALTESKIRLQESNQIARVGRWEYLSGDSIIQIDADFPFLSEIINEKNISLNKLKSFMGPEEWKKLCSFINSVESKKNEDLLDVRITGDRETIILRIIARYANSNSDEHELLVGTFQDITDLKNMEISIREKSDLIQAIMNASPLGILQINSDGEIHFANTAARNMLRLENDKIEKYSNSRRTYINHITGEHDESFNPYRLLSDSKSGMIYYKHGMLFENGTKVILTLYISALPIMEDQTPGAVIVINDITEQENLRKQRFLSDEKYRFLFENANDGLIIHKINKFSHPGFIIEVNKKICEMLGYSKNELLKKSLPDFIFVNKEFKRSYFRKLKHDNFVRLQIQMIKSDGTLLPVELTSTVFKFEDNFSVLTSIRDISDSLQYEKEKQAQDQILVEKSRLAAIGEMVGAIAHQWKQPLSGLSIMVQDLEDAMEYGELDMNYMKEFSSMAMKQIDFMEHTIDDFRGLFRQDKRSTIFNVFDAASSVAALMEVQLSGHSIKLHVEYDSENSEYMVLGKLNEFKHVLLNIISNARDAHEAQASPVSAGKYIVMRLIRDGDEIIVEIYDNAGGVDNSIIDQLFEPYVSTREEKGTGIGLSLSRTIVNGMGGQIEVENINDGALFRITLPCAE